MSDTTLPTHSIPAEIAVLAERHRAANHAGMQVLNLLGSQADSLLSRLPDGVKSGLEEATTGALRVAYHSAKYSRGKVPDQKGWLNTAFATAMGAVGGAGGLASSLGELPVTTTVLLRAIQGIAVEHGFDPEQDEVARECLSVFASAGPLEKDDGADIAFLSARMALTGSTAHRIIAAIAPRMSIIMGQKLATQAVPVIGAAAGAAVNFAFTNYYQQMAHVHFGLLALSRDTGVPMTDLVGQMSAALEAEQDRASEKAQEKDSA
ncbi:EcsC family protein [Tropicibacter sp. R15_0]|uniref:EcsC family protein n=1 Tax=Tropicibacter sp. R15_0 TaxID=2821101 RepID=UPI001ADAF544|nr:EcsC family protein [Tropicibacter sp. R15_0]MBO9465190.1 EcsC family protein [Tropicibacter sp. R15_0]